jgi:hypothetical protein
MQNIYVVLVMQAGTELPNRRHSSSAMAQISRWTAAFLATACCLVLDLLVVAVGHASPNSSTAAFAAATAVCGVMSRRNDHSVWDKKNN